MQNYLRKRREAGFTLIELLIVIAIIGIIATILIPELLDALQKAKQKETVGEMDSMGTAMFEWITDMGGAAAAGVPTWATTGYTAETHDNVRLVLARCAPVDANGAIGAPAVPCPPVPNPTAAVQYIQDVPQRDGWGRDYVFFLDLANPLSGQVAAIYSCGRDDGNVGTTCTAGTPQAIPFPTACYASDIVWADGDFVAYPAARGAAETAGWTACVDGN